jgi:hypothetical protein
MNKNELLIKINEFTKENCSIGLKLGHKENKNYSFIETQVDNPVQKEIFNLLKTSIVEIVKENDLVNFDVVGKQDGTIELINVIDVEGYNIFLKDKNNSDNFTQNFNELGEINFYLLEIENQTDNIKVFRRYSKAKSLSKGILLRSVSSKLCKIEENIFQVDNIVDFIVINDKEIIVFNRYSFEVITNYKDNYMENLDVALSEIENSKLINNMDQFKEDCKNSLRIAKQFTKAMQESSISLILNNLGAVADAIKEAELPIEFINNKFQYESKEQLSILVALLSDKYAKTLIGKRITNS